MDCTFNVLSNDNKGDFPGARVDAGVERERQAAGSEEVFRCVMNI